MKKSIYSPEYGHVLRKLVDMRHAAGMTQRDLARKLEKEHSFVSRIEQGERRLDVREFFWVCRALGQDPVAAFRELVERFAAAATATDAAATPQLKAAEPGVVYRIPRRKSR